MAGGMLPRAPCSTLPTRKPADDGWMDVTITVRAHRADPGSLIDVARFIKFRDGWPRQLVYEKLPSGPSHHANKVQDLTIKDSVGIVIDSAWCLDKDSNHLNVVYGVAEATNQLWYNVKFFELEGWVRYDWVEEFVPG